MATKTISVHKIMIPELKNFKKKYYFLLAFLIFEYEPNGHFEDRLEIFGFSDMEMETLCDSFSFFVEGNNCIQVNDFYYSLIETMASILPLEERKLLLEHIILSSIDNASTYEDMKKNIRLNMEMFGIGNIPIEHYESLDFPKFFGNANSEFMNQYYPSKEDKKRNTFKICFKKDNFYSLYSKKDINFIC